MNSYLSNNQEDSAVSRTTSSSGGHGRGAVRKERNRRWKQRQMMIAAADQDAISWKRRRNILWLTGLAILAGFAGIPLLQELVGGLPISFAIQTKTSSSSTTADATTTTAPTLLCPLQPCHLNIVFMGDSLTRFMYISLAYFFSHNNTWMDPTAVPRMVSPDDILGNQKNHIWTPWYQASHAMLAPYEDVCDCYRQPTNWKQGIVENRYYYDPYRNITLTYIQSFGSSVPIRGHWHVQEIADARRQRYQQEQQQQPLLPVPLPIGTTRLYNSTTTTNSTNSTMNNAMMGNPPLFPLHQQPVPFSWSGNWSHAIRTQVSILKPHVVILNADKWHHEFSSKPAVREDLRLALEETGIPRAIWKTSTSNRGGTIPPAELENDIIMCDLLSSSSHDDDFVNATTTNTSTTNLNETTTLTTTILTTMKTHYLDNCLNISGWTKQIPVSYYNDNMHYYEPVYRQMNEQLLDLLGVDLEQGAGRCCAEFDSLNLTIPTTPYTSTTTTITKNFVYSR